MSLHARILPQLTLVLFSAGACSAVTPPPMLMHHRGTRPDPKGAVAATITGGRAGGVWVGDSAGGSLGLSAQIADDWRIGANGTVGVSTVGEDSNPNTDRPERLYAGRLYTVYNPASFEYGALTLGAGGGATDSGLSYLSFDLGMQFSYPILDVVTPYGGPVIAASIPLRRGPVVGFEGEGGLSFEDEGTEPGETPLRPSTTGYFGTTAGVAVHLLDNLWLTGELTFLLGVTERDDTASIGAVTGGLTWRFGP